MKGIKKFLGLFITLFLLTITSNVKAEILFDEEYGMKCEDIVEHPGGKASKTCTIGFTVTEQAVKINQLQGHFTLVNVTLDKKDIKLKDGWYFDSEDSAGKTYTFGTSKTSLDVGYHEIATITFYKVVNEQECHIYYYLSGFKKIDRSCKIYQGTYYDKNGNITTQQAYENECLEKPKVCTKDGNKYYGKDGKEVNQKQYQIDCETNICKDFGDGIYFGIKGNKVDQETYQKECTTPDKHYCEYTDGSYYDKEGNTTTKDEYEFQCFTHICEVIDHKRLENGVYLVDTIYYGKDGKATTKEIYEKECFKHYCIKIGNDYFGKDGSIVNAQKYHEECEKEYICEKVDDTYYDINGNKVTKEQYEKSCMSTPQEGPKCKKVDDKYYDLKGKETTQAEYEKQCQKHSCEIIEDTYFDKNGTVVDKATYDKYCPTPENPSTGNFLPLIPLFILFIGGAAIYIYTKKEDKLI